MNKRNSPFVYYQIIKFFCCCCLVACQQQSEKPVLSDEKLSRIMADLHLADAATNGIVGNAKDSLHKVYVGQVMTIHGIDFTAFEQELKLRSQDLPRLERIQNQIDTLLKQ